MAKGPGNTRPTARKVAVGPTPISRKGTLSALDGTDFWRIDLGARSSFTANLTGLKKNTNADLLLLNGSGAVVASSRNTKNKAESITQTLEAGTFYIRALRRAGTTSYTLNLAATPSPLNPGTTPGPSPVTDPGTGPGPGPTSPPPGISPEIDGDSFATPRMFSTLSFNTQVSLEAVSDADPNDFFQFSVPAAGQLNLQLVGAPAGADIELYDINQNKIAPLAGDGNNGDSITKIFSNTDVGATYYVKVVQTTPGTTNYSLNFSLLPPDVAGNDFVNALTLPLNVTIPPAARSPLQQNEFVGGTDQDFYKFTINSQSFVSINLANVAGNADINLYQEGIPQPLILSSTRPGNLAEQLGGTLGAGIYYIQVLPADPVAGSPYSLSIFAEATSGIPSISRDISFGDSSSDVQNITKVGNSGALFFSAANDDGTGRALWASLGGAGGGGTLDKTVKIQAFTDLSSFVDLNGTLYFYADNGVGQSGIWRSDGTKAEFVTPIVYGGTQIATPTNLTAAGNRLYFIAPAAAGTDQTALRLWSSDGTAAGTAEVTQADNISSAGLSPVELVNAGGTLFYVASDPNQTSTTKGREIWRVNNTTGKAELLDIYEGQVFGAFGSSNPTKLTAVGDSLFFVATSENLNREVQRVKIAPGAQFNRATDLTTFDADGNTFSSSLNGIESDSDWNFGVVGGNTLYFSSTAPDKGGTDGELFKVDVNGAASSLSRVRGSDTILVQNARGLTGFGNKLYFKGVDPNTNKEELWVTDGTDGGTLRLTNRADGLAPINNLVVSGSKLYFTMDDINPNDSNRPSGNELWRVKDDGTGAQLVYDINPSGTIIPANPGNPPDVPATLEQYIPNASAPSNLIDVNGQLFFTANNGLNGIELWSIFG